MHLTQALHRSAQIARNEVAIVFGERQTTWGQFIERVSRLAHGLVKLGLKRGERVAVIGLNSDRYMEVYYALAWMGAVIVPGNTRWSLAEHIYGIEDSTPSLLFVDSAFAQLAAPIVEKRPMPVVFMDGDPVPDGMIGYEWLVWENEPIEDQCGHDDELYGIFYTGGTTGHPKGVMLSHKSLMMNALYGNATGSAYSGATRMLHSAPLFHMAAFAAFLGTTMAGGSHVIVPGFDPALVVKAITEQGANQALFVPTMFTFLSEYLARNPADLSSMQRIVYGASPISETLLKRAMEIFPNAGFNQAYGQSELGPVATSLLPEFHLPQGDKRAKLRSAGRAFVGVDVRIADENLKEVPRGEVGEIIVRHDGIMLGYWNMPEQTAAAIVDGWVKTGDAGYMDDEGFIYIVDRVKDMIISGGENVFSAEVENTLSQHVAVLECAVIGIPDDRWGERVHAIVRLRDGHAVNEDALISHCRELISGYKCPRSVEFRAEPLPLSAAGKILKRELRAPHWQGRATAIGS